MAAIVEHRQASRPRKTSGGGDAFRIHDPRLQPDHVWPPGDRRGRIEDGFADRSVVYKETSNTRSSSDYQLTFLNFIKTLGLLPLPRKLPLFQNALHR